MLAETVARLECLAPHCSICRTLPLPLLLPWLLSLLLLMLAAATLLMLMSFEVVLVLEVVLVFE